MTSDEAGTSDWEEQDLLTVDLAAERVAAEIEVLTRRIAEAPENVDLTVDRRRLQQLREAHERLTKRSS